MPDLAITAANVLSVAEPPPVILTGVAGAVLGPGQPVYQSAVDNLVYPAQADGAAAEADVQGITLHAAHPGQPIALQSTGKIAVGAILTVGQIYVLSASAGGIAPVSDLVSTNFVTLLGVAVSTSQLTIALLATGVQKP